jgi:hypothetical protein
VTAAAVLAVVEPSMTGIGGDLFAIVYEAKTNTLHGLNASGRSPHAAALDEFTRRNLAQVPTTGELSVTVPGVIDGWSELLSKHGTLSLANAIAPAIDYATHGFAVSEIVGAQWLASAPKLAADRRAAETFLPGGQPPKTGDVFANPRLAATLRIVADGGREAFYNGPIARAIAADMRARNGLLAERDFADHASDWIRPIATKLPRLRRLRAAAEHAGVSRARDAEHSRGLRHRRDGAQLRGLPARARRGEAHRLRRPRRLSRRPRGCPSRSAADAHLERVCGGSAEGDRCRANHRGSAMPFTVSPVSTAATRSISPLPTATATPSR